METFFALLYVIALIIGIKEIINQNKKHHTMNENKEISSKNLAKPPITINEHLEIRNTVPIRKIKIRSSYNLIDRQLNTHLKKGDEQIRRINSVTDENEAITVYENIIFEEGMYFDSDTHIMRLAELYYKTEQYDKAWNYLNELQFVCCPNLMYKIRCFQIKVLKKENKNIDALAMLMCAQLYDCSKHGFNIDKFKNEAKILLKKIGFDENEHYADYLVYIINNQLKITNSSNSIKEVNLRKALKNFLNEINSKNDLSVKLHKATKSVEKLQQNSEKGNQEKSHLNIKPGYYPEKLQAILNEQPPNTSNINALNIFYKKRAEKLYQIHLANISNFVREPNKYNTTPITSVEKSFLKYIDSQPIKSPSIAQYWTYEYNIDFNKVVNRLIDNSYLEISNYQNPETMKVAELKTMLNKFGIKATGNKNELIQLVHKNITKEMLENLPKDTTQYFRATNNDLINSINSSITKDFDLENKCYSLILNNEFSEAYKLICEYERTKNIPRGIGNNWNNEILDINKMKKFQDFMNGNIANDTPNELKSVEKSLKACIIYGEMMGAGLDKRVNMFLNINSVSIEKQKVKSIMNNLCFKLWE